MKQDLTLKKMKIGEDNITIKKFIKGIEGGRTLDVANFAEDVIYAGHVIVKNAEGNYKPLGVKDGAYAMTGEGENAKYLEEGETYAGMLYVSCEKEKPAAAIMTWGIVNEETLPYAVPADFKTAMPHIDYQKDEEA